MKTTMNNFGTSLDKLGKSIGRIKTVGVLVLVFVFLLSIMQQGCNKSKMEEMVETLTGLNISNDILQLDIKEKDSILLSKENNIILLRDSLQKSEQAFNSLENEYLKLGTKYRGLSEKLIKIPVDSSYSFLTTKAYPYRGDYKYLFNGPQVKGIHLTYLENISLLDLNKNLLLQKSELSGQLKINKSMDFEHSLMMLAHEEKSENYEQIIANKNTQIKTEKEISKRKKRKTFFRELGIAAVATLVGIVIGS